MIRSDDGLLAALLERGVSRRAFLQFSAAMAAALALPAGYAPRIAAAVEAAPRLPLVWLRGQTCGGNTAALLRTPEPTVADLLLDALSVEYHESLMASSGAAATAALADAMERHPDGYLAVVEGAVPTADAGVACLVGGRPFADIVREVCDGAAMTIAVGSCAFDGGAATASGGSTGATGVRGFVAGDRLVALPGCPVNSDNLAATIVHYLATKEPPPADRSGRPYFAYGSLIHNQCERRSSFEYGQFVTSWGDEGAQKGWCLYKLGCKGPQSFANCASQRYADKASWPIRAGHGCIACTMPGFWDSMGAAYLRLPSPMPVGPQLTVDQIGMLVVGGIAGVTMVHGTASIARSRMAHRAAHRREIAPAVAAAGGEATMPAAGGEATMPAAGGEATMPAAGGEATVAAATAPDGSTTDAPDATAPAGER